MRRLIAAAVLIVLGLSVSAYADPANVFGREELRSHAHKDARPAITDETGIPLTSVSDVPCVDGMAGTFPCDGIDLLSFVPSSEFGGSDPLGFEDGGPASAPLGGGVSDIWGWVDEEGEADGNGKGDEYVIAGKTNGVAFFNITDPTAPVFLGELENPSPGQLVWHDIKVHKNHAFIVSESVNHGLSVFDLTQLRGMTEPQTFRVSDTTNIPTSFSVHNIAINEESEFAYLVGGNNGIFVPTTCQGGLEMFDISNPALPVFAGCHSTGEGGGPSGLTSYIHDTQCVTYRGPDTEFTDRELCFNSSEDHMSIVDVTNKLLPEQVALVEYPDTSYAHQGWLTEDFSHFIMGDELDEPDATEDGEPIKTRSLVFDVSDIRDANFTGFSQGETGAIDHNMYTLDGLVYQSNYAAGLRVLDIADVADVDLEGNFDLPQVAFFDGFPAHDDPEFVGTWSNYPYFPSGTIAMTGIDEGLFFLKLQDGVGDPTEAVPTDPAVPAPAPDAAPIVVRDLDSACPEGRVPANSHTDHEGNVHDRAIECMVWWEIAKGTTNTDYDPEIAVNREQMASFVARLIEKAGGTLPSEARNAYSDDDTSHHHANINKLAAAGLVDGKGDGRFAPRETVSRAQMAKFIVNAYEFVSDRTLDDSADYFGDDNGDQLESFINKSAAAGFTTGRNGGYEPRLPVLRDQMASFLARDLDLLVNEGTTPAKQ